jgi:60 kDa SS-A/Ro ribonucleoprotein
LTDPLRAVVTRETPQSLPTDERQVPNSAGGFTFRVTPWQQLRRFLLLGAVGGTYYTDERELTLENAQVVFDLVKLDGLAVLREIVQISESGRAPKQNPTIFALAVVISHGDLEARRAACDVLRRVARTGTHLLQFNRYAAQLRGRGRVLDRAIENWYLQGEVNELAYQVVKYRQREGWTHRDVLRLAKPKPAAHHAQRRALFDWICHGSEGPDYSALLNREALAVVDGFERVQRAVNVREVVTAIHDYRLTWEMLPSEMLNQRPVWEALLERGVPQTALMRQLPRLTNLGLLSDVNSGWTAEVCSQLSNAQLISRARLHPINILVALRTYASGHSFRGSQTWTPSRRVVDALDAAFYAAYGAVVPTGQRTMLALDVSGSMTAPVSGIPLSAREVSAALALVTANVEPTYTVVGFTSADSRDFNSWRNITTGLTPLSISPRQRLDDAVGAVAGLPFGRTDCALPMEHASRNRLEIDTFVIYTDNETYAGRVHPHEALRNYRERSGIDARLVVVALTSTGFSIADPNDAGMLDVVGFDSALPALISDFSRGEV